MLVAGHTSEEETHLLPFSVLRIIFCPEGHSSMQLVPLCIAHIL